MPYVAYLSHPIGESSDYAQRGDNLVNAGKWLNFLIDHTRWAMMCPWLAYTMQLGTVLYGPRALADQITLLGRCDILVQVGGTVSPHMLIEANHAKRNNMPIFDLTRFGDQPSSRESVRQALALSMRQQIEQVRSMMSRRRVWLPPLSNEDIEALRKAETTLRKDPNSDEACVLIQRIVYEAMRPM